MKKEGTVYFIQPTELINTKKYKIGMSRENDLCRLKKYHKGTRFICVMSCKYPKTLEETLKKIFQTKYKLIAGSEYFEGNEEEMLDDFLKIIKENKNSNLKDKDKETDNLEEEINNIEIIKKENIEIKIIDKINKKVYFCDICKKKYKSYKCLWSHNKKFHQKPDIPIHKHQCTHCKRQFNDKSNRYKHQKICKNKKSEIEELKEKVNTQINLHDNLIKIIEKLANSNNN
jgi:hypothetical protein